MDGVPTTDDTPGRGLRIIAADEDPQALRRTAEILEGLGHEVTALTASVSEACDLAVRDEPDAAIVVVHRDREHALDLIEEVSEVLAGPVVALLAEPDATFAEAAAARGLDAMASEPTADGVQTALEVAMHRHAERSRLAEQVSQLEHALERRAVIERAKGTLMERHGIGERQAFEQLRSQARSRSISVVSLAQELTTQD
ncbi:MAG: ANTAR domain-containing response regulator [Solirubrobacteraceae bacterium]